MKSFNDSLDEILDLTLKSGADEAEVFSHSYKSFETKIEKNELQISSSTTGEQIGIRMLKDNKLGFVSSNSSSKNIILPLIQEGLEIANNSPVDKFNGFPKPMKIKKINKLYDPDIESVDIKYAIEKTNELLQETKKIDKRLSIDGGGFEISTFENSIINSGGIKASYVESIFIYSIFEFAIENNEVSSFQYAYDAVSFKKQVDVLKVVNDAAQKTLSSLGARKLEKSFKGLVLLTPEAVIDLILNPIIFAINSDRVQKKVSPFRKKLGKKVAPEFININDNGTLPGKIGSAPFDREGVPHKPLEVIKEGLLSNFLYNSYTARKEKRNSTGHASGSAGSLPGISITNLILEPGKRVRENIIKDIDEGLIVTRFSGNLDHITGDFSGLVKGGFYIKNGEIKFPVKGVMIAGNSYDSIKNIKELSKDSKTIINITAPDILLDNISITST